jgi:transmembrane sensor
VSGLDTEEHLKREAQEWLTRLTSGRATVDDAAAAKLWCGQSAAHARAFAEATLLWDSLEPVARQIASESANAKRTSARINLDRRAILVGSLAASTAAAGYLAIRPPFELWPSISDLMADYRTGTAERRRVKIADGIAVEMNTRTSFNVSSKAGRDRRIELVSGEVAVTTDGGQTKPVIVSAAGGSALATQAKFDIYCDGASASVTCMQGIVAVEYRARKVVLGERQQVIYDQNGLGVVASVDTAAVTSWREGRLVFHGIPLAQVIAQINRYRTARIVLLNAALGKRMVDATLPIDHTDQIVDLVRTAYGASITTLPGGIVVLS